jgi:hypothetical protein
MEEIMKKRQKEADDAYEAQWDGGRGAHHPDYDPEAIGDDVVKANRATEELYNAIVKNDVRKVYEKIDEGADVAFVFGRAYQSQGAPRFTNGSITFRDNVRVNTENDFRNRQLSGRCNVQAVGVTAAAQ